MVVTLGAARSLKALKEKNVTAVEIATHCPCCGKEGVFHRDDWVVETRDMRIATTAIDQFEAMDVFKEHALQELGFIITARRIQDPIEDQYAARTSLLLGQRWENPIGARMFIEAMVAGGGPDTSDVDIPS